MLQYVVESYRRIGKGSLLQSQPTVLRFMAQACSILYKTKLPLILVFNKCDVQSHEFAIEWMKVLASSVVTAGASPAATICLRGVLAATTHQHEQCHMWRTSARALGILIHLCYKCVDQGSSGGRLLKNTKVSDGEC